MTLKANLAVDNNGNAILDDNGNPQINYDWTSNIYPDGVPEGVDPVEAGGVLVTGEAKGVITLSDGTKYDVTPSHIEHAPHHAGPICHHIEKQLEREGHFLNKYGDKIGHTCTELCGDEHDGSTFTNVFRRDHSDSEVATADTADLAS